MAKCKDCGKPNAEYFHYDGDRLCSNCIGHYFTCPECGTLFDEDDFEHGDAGNGFCKDCAPNH